MTSQELTFVTLFTERKHIIDRWLEGLEALYIDRKAVKLVWVCSGKDEEFFLRLQKYQEVNGAQWRGTVLLREPDYLSYLAARTKEETKAVSDKVASLYNKTSEYADGQYTLMYEDDVVPRPGAVRAMLAAMGDGTTWCGARVIYRPSYQFFPNKVIAWNFAVVEQVPSDGSRKAMVQNIMEVKHEGAERVGATHTAFALVTTEFFKQYRFKSTHPDIENAIGHDIVAGYEMHLMGRVCKLHWGAHCWHYDYDGIAVG